MIFDLVFKTPDAESDGIRCALQEANSDAVDPDTGAMDRNAPHVKAMLQLAQQYVSYGELIRIRFDTLTGIVKVLPVK